MLVSYRTKDDPGIAEMEFVAGGMPVLDWVPPVLGHVYGVLLNDRAILDGYGDSLEAPPYKGRPKAPILYLKTANTWSAHQSAIVVPNGIPRLAIGATLGLVIGKTALRVPASAALSVVAGYVVINDVSVPHENVYRPSVRFRCRDGFCAFSPWIVPASSISQPNLLAISVAVNGQVVQQASLANLVRPIEQLIADVSEFMTLSPGDVLHVGTFAGAPTVEAGERVRIEIAGVGVLENDFVVEDVPGASA